MYKRQVPRVNIEDLSTIDPIIGGSTTGLLVYNTNTTTGEGFHYWDGIEWVLLVDTNSEGGNIYNTDDTLTGDRTVSQDTNTLTFEGDAGRDAITIRRTANGSETGLAFKNSGSAFDAALFMESGGNQGLVIAAEGNENNPDNLQANAVFNNDGTTSFSSQIEVFENIANTGDITARISSSNDDGIIEVNANNVVNHRIHGNDTSVFNDQELDLDTRFATDNQTNTLFIDGGNDNIGIGTGAPDASAQLELADTDRGILINRVALSATDDASPVTSPTFGLMVFNTATAGTGANSVLPGFYYWDGAEWIALSGTNGRDWSLQGNDGTDPTTDFVGTLEDTDLVFRTDNTERARILGTTGALGIGRFPFNNAGVTIENFEFGSVAIANSTGASFFGMQNGTGQGVLGMSTSTGQGVFGQNTGAGIAVAGVSTGTGTAVIANNTGTGLGLFGSSITNSAIQGSSSAANVGTSLFPAVVAFGTATEGSTGLLAVTSEQSTVVTSVGLRTVAGSTTSITPNDFLNVGIAVNATDLGLSVITENPIDTNGESDAAMFRTNFNDIPTDPDNNDPQARLAGFQENVAVPGLVSGDTFYGAFLYSGGGGGGSSFAYAGARHDGTNYKIIGNGTVSTVVEDESGNPDQRIMFAPEAPEVLFEDYGTGQLVNGEAQITIDPIFSRNIVVDTRHPLKVFIQLEGDCNGVYVTNKSATGFTVKELQKGKANVNFSWHIVANRKDDIGRSNGEGSRYSNLRFPQAPTPKKGTTYSKHQIEKPKITPITPTPVETTPPSIIPKN